MELRQHNGGAESGTFSTDKIGKLNYSNGMEKAVYQEYLSLSRKRNVHFALPGGTGKITQVSKLLQMKTWGHTITLSRVDSVTISGGFHLLINTTYVKVHDSAKAAKKKENTPGHQVSHWRKISKRRVCG